MSFFAQNSMEICVEWRNTCQQMAEKVQTCWTAEMMTIVYSDHKELNLGKIIVLLCLRYILHIGRAQGTNISLLVAQIST